MYSRILVATDGSELADKGVEAGLALARALAARVVLVTASEPWQDIYPGDPNGMALSSGLRDDYRKSKQVDCERILAQAQTRAKALGIDAVETVYVADRMAADAILETAEARGADLIVMGAWGQSRITEWVLGGATRHLLQHSDIALLVAH